MCLKIRLIKKILISTFLVAFFSPALCHAAVLPVATGNLLGDNSFELSEPNGGFPDSGYWQPDLLDSGWAGCDTQGRLGQQGLWLATGFANDQFLTRIYQDFPTWPGRTFFASAWVRMDSDDFWWLDHSRASVKIEFLDESKNTLAQYTRDLNYADPSWMLLYFATHPAPAHTRFVRFILCLEKPHIVGLSLVNFDDCILREFECADCIRLDEIPDCSGDDLLKGAVVGVDPEDYRVGVYIFVDDWWPKLSFASPWTDINPDGSWQCDICREESDPDATKVMAFLVPKDEISEWPVDFNNSVGLSALPGEAFRFPSAGSFRPASFDTIQFAGRNWLVKDSRDRRVNPGQNLFDPDNAWVDGDNNLHLKISNVSGQWRCAEVWTEDSLGDGLYTFRIESDLSSLDPGVVLGLFTWDEFAPHYANREMDFEFSRWGDPDNNNAQYVIQPGQLHEFNIESADPCATTHTLDWSVDGAAFESFFGPVRPADQSDLIDFWTFSGNFVPRPGNENIRLNLWLPPGHVPYDANGVEVVISDFGFVPCSYEVETNKLDFSSVLISKKSTKAVRISNGRRCLPYVVTAEVNGPDAGFFMVADRAFSMEPGVSKDIDVTFMPDSRRLYEATLVITGDGKTNTIPLTGRGALIGYTSVPTMAGPDLLEGMVSGVNHSDYRVVSYVQVFDKWYIKPLCMSAKSSGNPLKQIGSSGVFLCDVDIESTDKAATQVASFLVPKYSDYPPCVLDSLDDSRLSQYDMISADKPRLGILKVVAKSGAEGKYDEIIVEGRYYITMSELIAADELCITISHQDSLIWTICVPFDPQDFFERGRFKYDKAGVLIYIENSATLLNSYAGDFTLELKNADLTCLKSPVDVTLEVGAFSRTATADESLNQRIINGSKLIPLQFLAGCSNALRVDKVSVNSSSLSVKGALAFGSQPPDLTEQDVELGWGNATFTVPAGSFQPVGNSGLKFKCSSVHALPDGVVSALFDFQKFTFQVKVKKAKIDNDSDTLVFNLAVAGFSEGVSVETNK